MKQVLKFIVSLIIIAIMIFTVYFLVQNSSKYIGNYVSGDNTEVLFSKNSGENISSVTQDENYVENKIDVNDKIESGNNFDESGENVIVDKISSGDTVVIGESGNKIYNSNEVEVKINDIKEIENKNKTSNVTETFEDSVGLDILGIENKDFFSAFNLSELTVTVQTAGSMVYIIPNSDFIDNAQYHYDSNGKLVLYIRELIGVGGEIRYYYENNQFIKQESKIDDDIQIDLEANEEILNRSKIVYDNYLR